MYFIKWFNLPDKNTLPGASPVYSVPTLSFLIASSLLSLSKNTLTTYMQTYNQFLLSVLSLYYKSTFSQSADAVGFLHELVNLLPIS